MRAIVFGATVAAVFSLCCSGRGWAGEPVNPNLSREARKILSYLESAYQKQVLAGNNVYVHTPDDYEQTGKLPKWLYALPWWGAPSHRRPADWAVRTMRHDFIVTLDELPAFGEGNIAPHVEDGG